MRDLHPWETTKLNELEAKQIAEEIAMCVNAGVTSWELLKALRSMRQAAEEALNKPSR